PHRCGFGEVLHRIRVDPTWLRLMPGGGHGRKKPRPLMARGKLAERLEVEFGPFRSASSREPKCFLPTSIVQLLTECIFWTTVSRGIRFQKKPVFTVGSLGAGGAYEYRRQPPHCAVPTLDYRNAGRETVRTAATGVNR